MPPYDSEYEECTIALMRSEPQILASISDIKAYSKVYLGNGISILLVIFKYLMEYTVC